MARICEGADCGKRVGTTAEPGESFIDPRGDEHDFCHACWVWPLACVACTGTLRRGDVRLVACFLSDDRLVFAHRPCVQRAAEAYFTLIADGVVAALPTLDDHPTPANPGKLPVIGMP